MSLMKLYVVLEVQNFRMPIVRHATDDLDDAKDMRELLNKRIRDQQFGPDMPMGTFLRVSQESAV